MLRISFTLAVLAILGGNFLPAEDLDFSEIQPLLEKYCYKCHDGEVQKGEFRLDTYSSFGQVLKDRKKWLKVLEQLKSREMPTKEPLPGDAEYDHLVRWVDKAVNDVDWEKRKHPGHVTLPRLTNVEYDRTIRDLLGMQIGASRIFPADGEGKSGFTNDRDNLFLSSSQLEKYFTAAEWAVDSFIGLRENPRVQLFEAEKMFMTESRSGTARFKDGSEGFVLNRGQMTLYENVEAPFRGIYQFRLRMNSTKSGTAGVLLRIDDELVGEFETRGRELAEVTLPVFLNPGSHQMAFNFKPFPKRIPSGAASKMGTYKPLSKDAGTIVTRESKIRAPKFVLAKKESEIPGLAGLVARWNGTEVGIQRPYEWLRLHGKDGNTAELNRFKSYVVDRSKSQESQREKIAKALGISIEQFQKRYENANKDALVDRAELIGFAGGLADREEPGLPGIDWIAVKGPLLPDGGKWPGRAQKTARALADEKAWKAWFPDFLTRAFRRKILPEELERYREIYSQSKKNGNHTEAARRVLLAGLVSPNFLYRAEEIPTTSDGKPFQLDSSQLASRMSYFLWQTMPDDELVSADLRDPKIRARQVERMLQDWRAEIFFDTFPGQWLGYESLGKSVIPDARKFPTFTPDLAESMKTETRLWFQHIFQNDRPLTDLLASGETFLDAALARHYEIDEFAGSDFELVRLSGKDREIRGGLLGMGSILTATSTPVRTSPVLRGVFVMERLLGDDPGLPPADAGELPGNAGGRGKTVREELALHRDAPACAGCHDKIDPIGFGLDHFDAVGRYRIKNGKKPIEARGELPDGSIFEGSDGLRKYILEHREDDFARIVVERLLSHALGRELQTYDEPAIRGILEKTKPKEYRARAVLEAIISSYPFQNQHPSAEWNP